MNDSVKLYLVTCSNCKNRQVWDSATPFKVCNECDSAVVLRTASTEQLQAAKKQAAELPLAFSTYLVYTLSPEDVEVAVMEKKRRQNKLKEDVAERKQYAETLRYTMPALRANGNKKNSKPKTHSKKKTKSGKKRKH